MGGVCCNHSITSRKVQPAVLDAVIQKPPTILATTVDPSIGVDSVKQELSAYLDQYKKEMSPRLARIFLAAAESPEKSLSALKLKLCALRDSDWAHFSHLLLYDRYISKLLVWKTPLSFVGFTHICASVQNIRNLRVLSLGDVGLGFHNLEPLAEALKGAGNLVELALTVNELRREHVAVLAPAISTLHSLHSLNLDENRIGDEGCMEILSTIQRLDSLELLSLRYNCISPFGCSKLLAAVLHKPKLKVLMEGNEIGEEDMDRLQV